jgi:hypothetical protein
MFMKNLKKIKSAWYLTLFIVISFVAGCGSSADFPAGTKIYVQLENAATEPYPVGGMTVSIQKAGGFVYTGVTDDQGIATFNVTSTGTYSILQVEGVDATALAEGSDTGREFKKANPLADPYPNLTHVYGVPPTASVTALGQNYTVRAAVPVIHKVTVLKVGSATSETNGVLEIAAGTGAFAGRVILTNLNFSDTSGGIRLASSDVNLNRMMLYPNVTAGHPTPEIIETAFYGGPFSTHTDTGTVSSYTQVGPIYFEAPGTDSGDWALGYNLITPTDVKTRSAFGGANETINFPGFNGGAANFVLRTWSWLGGVGHNYSLSYRIFKFDAF